MYESSRFTSENIGVSERFPHKLWTTSMIPDNVGICIAVKAANGYYSNRMETHWYSQGGKKRP